jgi:hypothetical protein
MTTAISLGILAAVPVLISVYLLFLWRVTSTKVAIPREWRQEQEPPPKQ